MPPRSALALVTVHKELAPPDSVSSYTSQFLYYPLGTHLNTSTLGTQCVARGNPEGRGLFWWSAMGVVGATNCGNIIATFPLRTPIFGAYLVTLHVLWHRPRHGCAMGCGALGEGGGGV